MILVSDVFVEGKACYGQRNRRKTNKEMNEMYA